MNVMALFGALVGVALLVAGVWMMFPPAAVIIAGLLMIACAVPFVDLARVARWGRKP